MIIDRKIINQAKEKLGDRNADIIADIYHVNKWDSRNKKGCCPFHSENTPSFIYNAKGYFFKCFGCGKNVDIIDAYMSEGKSYLEACQTLFEEAGISYNINELNVKTKGQYKYPHKENDLTENCEARKYLNLRKISNKTIDDVGIKQDAHGNIAFEYYDENNVLTMVKYRPSRKINKENGDIKSWCQKDADTSPILWRMNKINPCQPLILTEGECMAGDSEVLTPNGWVRLDNYSGESVLQINNDLSGSFVRPIAYVKHEYNGTMCSQVGRNISYTVTESHNVVYIDRHGSIVKKKASDVKNIGNGYIPTVTNVDGCGIPLTNDQIALYLAISADCTIDVRKLTNKRYCRFSVKKKRKYDRMIGILDRLGMEYFTNSHLSSGYMYIGFPTPDFVKSKKIPKEWIGLATLEQRKFIISEMVWWDGNHVNTRNQCEYSSSDIENATTMQAIASTSGYHSSIIHRKNKIGEWYKVSILFAKKGVSHQKDWDRYQYNGIVYCVTVPTGMIFVRQNGKTFVTGNCDALSVIEAGFNNVTSVPLGSQNLHWIEECFDWLEQFDSIIICGDNDEPGVKMRKEAISRLGSWRCKYVKIPEYFEDEKGKHRIKDANEVLYYMGKEALRNLIQNAEEAEVSSVVNVSDIEDLDISEIDGVETGIEELDHSLMRLFYGTLTVVSGLPSSGKTSFLSQLICQSLDQDITPFFFSREMPNYLQRSWLYSIMAGPGYAERYETNNGTEYYKVNQDAKTHINKYYNKKWFLYRDDASNKLDDILISMENCLRKYGCKLFVLDNLMTIDIGGDAESELKKQTDAINSLIAFAIKWQAAVILVCHPRKMPKGEDVGTYDISGTANIINLAHRTISLRRIDNDRENSSYNVKLTIIKDRLFGRSNKQINLYYDVPSRRFYTNDKEYNYHYKWEESSGLQQKNLSNSNFEEKEEEKEIYGDIF